MNNKLSRLHYPKNSKKYEEIQQKIKRSGIYLSPESFQTIRLILPSVIIVFYVLIKVINYINLKLSIEELTEAARILNNKAILNIHFNISMSVILLIGLVTFIIPEIILRLMIRIRTRLSKRKSLILQTYAIMLLKTNKPVKQILISLYERADSFKPILETAINKFSFNQVAAIEELKNSAPKKSDFINICIALRQAIDSDRGLSIIYLENHRKLSREVNKQIRIRDQTRNQGIGILIMMIPLLVSIALVGYPWLMYTIKAVYSIPA